MKKNILICFILSICLLFCSCGSKHPYQKVKKPYLASEKTDSETFVDTSLEVIMDKIDKGDSFILFGHKTGCAYCRKMIDEYLNPFIKDTKTMIYAFDTTSADYKENKDDFIDFLPENIEYVFEDKNQTKNIYVPVIWIISESKILDYSFGYNNYSIKMIKAYFVMK